MVNFRDISERVREEQMIKEKEAMNEALINAISDMILIIYKNGVIKFYKRPKNTYGIRDFAESQFLNKNINQIFSSDNCKIINNLINVTLESKKENILKITQNLSGINYEFDGKIHYYNQNEVIVICNIEKV